MQMFTYSAQEIEAFTEGDCWELAQSVSALSDYPVVTIAHDEHAYDWYHAGNTLPSGLIVDIEGIWTESAWLSVWSDRVASFQHDGKSPALQAVEWDHNLFVLDVSRKDFGLVYEISQRAYKYASEIIRHAAPHLHD